MGSVDTRPAPPRDALSTATPQRQSITRDRHRHRRFAVAVAVSLFLLDLALLCGAFWLANELATRGGWSWLSRPRPADDYLLIAGLTIAITMASFIFGGIYTGRRGISRLDDATRVTVRITLAALAGLALSSIIAGPDLSYSRRMFLLAWLLAIAGVVTGHFIHTGIVAGLRAHGIGADRLLVVGAGATGELVLDKLARSPQLGYDVVGVVRHRPWPPGEERSAIGGAPVLGMSVDLREIVADHDIDEIIVAMSGTAHEEILDVLLQIGDLPVAVRIYPDSFRLLTSDVLSISDLNGLPTVHMRTIGLRPVERVIKRAMDLVVSVVMLVAFAPLMLLVAALIKLTSPGPVFFLQERVGQDGRAFHLIKFRTMPVDAEAETGPVFARPDDTRPTRLGRILRRYSIDELPQFINVLYGEMSVVGPRPERPYFVEQFRRQIPAYMARHQEKAGITGWAQVNGLRGDTSIEERTRYDLYYVENWSLLFDIRIMIKTLFHIFQRDSNAY
ncbi:MAG TPA: undecaprenyl-phosphate glucose phosphotransferase [Thermomicrobiales bacterium]|nr:undecaprenyl-phosphate glucose phosphotransferase [Thermomicrobiales bacterium]